METRLPDTITWLGRGEAVRLPERGMDDYQRGNGNAMYRTPCGAMLLLVHGKWRARYKNYTTRLTDNPEKAIADLNQMSTEQAYKAAQLLMLGGEETFVIGDLVTYIRNPAIHGAVSNVFIHEDGETYVWVDTGEESIALLASSVIKQNQ